MSRLKDRASRLGLQPDLHLQSTRRVRTRPLRGGLPSSLAQRAKGRSRPAVPRRPCPKAALKGGTGRAPQTQSSRACCHASYQRGCCHPEGYRQGRIDLSLSALPVLALARLLPSSSLSSYSSLLLGATQDVPRWVREMRLAWPHSRGPPAPSGRAAALHAETPLCCPARAAAAPESGGDSDLLLQFCQGALASKSSGAGSKLYDQ